MTLQGDVTELLVTTFHELRSGKTTTGKAVESPSTVMSTAEAVSVGVAAGFQAYYFGTSEVTPEHLVHNMVGTALKDEPDDKKKLRHYFEHAVKGRKSASWKAFYDARRHIE